MNKWSDLTDAETKLIPTAQDCENYRKLGWYKSDVIIPDELIDNALVGAKALANGEVDHEIKKLPRYQRQTDQGLINIEFASLQNNKIAALASFRLIGAIACRLTRARELRLFSDSLLCKLPQLYQDIPNHNTKSIVGWHTDKAYWPTCTSENMLTAWIPLQTCTIDMGPLVYINGSHNWANNPSLVDIISFRDNSEAFDAWRNRTAVNFNKSHMTLAKGQVCFHHCRLLHGSENNMSTTPRWALAIHIQDEQNKYQKLYNADGEKVTIGYDDICEKDQQGMPNYSDNLMFPMIFIRRN